MAFDQSTRNRLSRFVTDSKSLLTEEFTRQLQSDYGMDPGTGEVAELNKLSHLDDSGLETARLLRDTAQHYLASGTNGGEEPTQKARKDVIDRIIREQAFTVLNRLSAVRMAEARGLLIESVSNGHQSKGFKLYQNIAGSALGETGECYEAFVLCIFDEFAQDLPVLFDRFSPNGRLFPRASTLSKLLDLLNAPDLEELWGEDETVGWIYQYWNSREERAEMRQQSSAPRNSRELAVRNQFFTPRYVVEFLTDNTLGRIWYEMNQGKTRLTEACRYLVRRPTEVFLEKGEEAPEIPDQSGMSQAELLKQPVYIPFREAKDPRQIRLLDPACGSMHFGLYAFDLFEVIYEEAWEQGYSASLREDYPTREELLRDVPRLIMENNIHGVDIDPRAVQIAGLSLWLRAHRSWQSSGIRLSDRPTVRRSNVVCAEPMPGNETILNGFLSNLDPPLLQQMVEKVFDKMKLAGQAGSLLRIEEVIKDSIHVVKEAWDARRLESGELFPADVVNQQSQGSSRYHGALSISETEVIDETFWHIAEQHVIDALKNYAERFSERSYEQRLFAEDAARGFAFIDLRGKRYDAVVMNPPFGLAPKSVFDELREEMPETYTELFASFVSEGLNLLVPRGRLGAITSRAMLFRSGLRAFRREYLYSSIDLLFDLAGNVMDDAFVEACAYTAEPGLKVTQLSAVDARTCVDRQSAWQAFKALRSVEGAEFYLTPWSRFEHLPGARFLYYLPKEISALLKPTQVFEPLEGTAREGMRTFDDFRFVHLLWEPEVDSIGEGEHWEPLAKGGPFARFYGQIHLVVNWQKEGAELSEVNRSRNGQTAQVRQASDYWHRGGCTYSKRSAKGFSARALPKGCIMGAKGPAVMSHGKSSDQYLLGWLNSRLITSLIELQANAAEFNSGIVKKLPWVEPEDDVHTSVESAAHDAALLARRLRRFDETDPYFVFRPSRQGPLDQQVREAKIEIDDLLNGLALKDKTITKTIDELYGVDSAVLEPPREEDEVTSDGADSEDSAREKSRVRRQYTQHVISCCVGCAVGRWDIRYATGDLEVDLPDPFNTLPPRPPGFLDLQSKSANPALDLAFDYPMRITWSGILVDEPGQTDDIVSRVREVMQLIWDNLLESIEYQACEVLEVKTLRDYFRRPSGFFGDHLQRYSKSRRQAPIYWPLSTQSGSYTLWIYYHRLSDQTLYTCVNDYVDRKLQNASDELGRLRERKGRTTSEEEELERLMDFEAELKEFRTELLRVAAFWKPNLNDGVQITASPLWKLFRLKKWQTTLKDTWQKLEAGEYDWAHLALSIWPDRVVRASHKDRSYAIAHNLEDELWHEVEVEKKNKGGKVKLSKEWQPRELTAAQLDAIVQRVKSAT